MTLAESCRPRRFDEMVGQEGACWMLRAMASADRGGRPFPGALLLGGPSGVGKTSLARILARSLNCAAPVEGEPCLVCDSCVQSLAGNHPAVLEPRSGFASADDARELVACVAAAHPFRHMVVVLDEAHAMSRQAWDVLLDTLECPPPAVTFVFCSTSPEKLRAEVLSRVYRFDLSAPSDGQVATRLVETAARAGRELPLDDAYEVALRAGGDVRTALQLLERGLLRPDGDVVASLGPSGFGLDLLEAAVRRDRTSGLRVLDSAWSARGNATDIYDDWMAALEQLLLVKHGVPTTDSPVVLRRLRELAPAYHDTMIAVGLETLTDWARRPGRRGSLGFAWTAFLKALNGPSAVDGLAVGNGKRGSRKLTATDLRGFTMDTGA